MVTGDQLHTYELSPNKVFCQTDAIVDWAADKAGLYSSDPVRRMKVFLKFYFLSLHYSLGENDC